MLVLAFAGTTTVHADARSEARVHYQTGMKFYAGGDYRSAIREFSSAQQLAPADLNNYNLALCYDKLGEPEPAIQYYRAYLDKVPNTDKRAEIEASIARLDAAARSIAKKEEARKAEDARRANEAKRAADLQAQADELARLEAARKGGEAPPPPPPPGDVGGGAYGGYGAGSTGTPGTGTTVPAGGDSQLDRVSRIDVNAVRDQRFGGGAQPNGYSPQPSPYGQNAGQHPQHPGQNPGQDPYAPQGGANGWQDPNRIANGAQPPAGAGASPGPAGAPTDAPVDPDAKPAEPVYKKWWFWAVVAVSAYVVYQIANEDSRSSAARTMFPMGTPQQAAQPGGLTLMRW